MATKSIVCSCTHFINTIKNELKSKVPQFNISKKYAIVQVQFQTPKNELGNTENAKKFKIMKKCPLITTSTISIHFQGFITFQFTFMLSGNTLELVKSSP